MITEIQEEKIKQPAENTDEPFDAEILPDASRVINGLRDTGYDLNTAIADIVDNSIAAEATKIDVSIQSDPKKNITVYIADNGIGMNQSELRNAMRYGSHERENKHSLGKFGLGLKTASTAFARCVSLISRGSDGIIRKIQWDLDYVEETNKWLPRIAEPDREELVALESVAGEGTGTLVVWEKVDRMLQKDIKDYSSKSNFEKALQNKRNNLRKHLGLTFQRFVDKSDKRARYVELTMSLSPVEAIDPFCVSEEQTIPYLSDPLVIDGDKDHPLTLSAFVLPKDTDFSTPEARKKANISNNTEGIYIYRENRLIHYGDWMGMYTNEPHLSLLRVEFDFDAALDDIFNVDIKKSRILPDDSILDYMKNSFLPAPRKAANDRYRKGKRKAVAEGSKDNDVHQASNKTIDETAKKAEETKMEPAGENKALLTNQFGQFQHKIEVITDPEKTKLRIIAVENLEAGNLWEPCLTEEGKHAVQINMSHPFYTKIYSLIFGQDNMVTGIDALLWALSEAENAVVTEDTEEYYEEMRTAVSRQLKKLISTLPDPNTGD